MDLRYWLQGIRFYIAVATLLISGAVWWWAGTSYGGSSLAPIRMEEVYAWLSLGCLGLALAIGPVYKLFPALPGKGLLFDARRLIGVSAAWFAVLHAGIAYGALFSFSNPFHLEHIYQVAFLSGTVAMIILLLMAFTSFDRAMRLMGVWWFRLHRLVYTAAILSLLHAFMIGVHATTLLPLFLLAIIATLLLAMHATVSLRGRLPTAWRIITISYAAYFLLAIFNYGLSRHLGYNVLLGLHGGGHHH